MYTTFKIISTNIAKNKKFETRFMIYVETHHGRFTAIPLV